MSEAERPIVLEETKTLKGWLRDGSFSKARLEGALRLGLETGHRRVYLGERSDEGVTVACYLRIESERVHA